MPTQAPPAPKKKPDQKPIEQQEQQPPEDCFWTRYSRHGEMQFSGAGSFAMHALVIGLIIILGKIAKDNDRVVNPSIGDVIKIGEGKGHGQGVKPGDGRDTEDGAGRGDGSEVKGPVDDGPLSLEQIRSLPPEVVNNPDAMQAIAKGNPNAAAWKTMGDKAKDKLRSGISPGGNGGSNSGGKTGSNGNGEGGGGMNDRTKRMFRWNINFERGSPASYLQQLQLMGAFLAIPVDYDKGSETWAYNTVRNLQQRPAAMKSEDLGSLNMIRWFNNDATWTTATVRELQIDPSQLKVNPTHFIVVFPRELEEEFRAKRRNTSKLRSSPNLRWKGRISVCKPAENALSPSPTSTC